jgi:hypothetical protein
MYWTRTGEGRGPNQRDKRRRKSPSSSACRRREDSAAIIFGESEGTARPQNPGVGTGKKQSKQGRRKTTPQFSKDQCSCCPLNERRKSFQSILGQVAGRQRARAQGRNAHKDVVQQDCEPVSAVVIIHGVDDFILRHLPDAGQDQLGLCGVECAARADIARAGWMTDGKVAQGIDGGSQMTISKSSSSVRLHHRPFSPPGAKPAAAHAYEESIATLACSMSGRQASPLHPDLNLPRSLAFLRPTAFGRRRIIR